MKLGKKPLRIALSVAAVTFGTVLAYIGAQASAPHEQVIKISAKRFDYMPQHLTLKKGVPVILEFTANDVLMGFNLPEFNLRADMVPGKVTRLRFVPDKTGTFTFLCDIFCGSGHEQMHGSITVLD